jgi:hypothetical protein
LLFVDVSSGYNSFKRYDIDAPGVKTLKLMLWRDITGMEPLTDMVKREI